MVILNKIRTFFWVNWIKVEHIVNLLQPKRPAEGVLLTKKNTFILKTGQE